MSIPTSLIIVVLVAAWLAVLVPMVARRREAVPETEVDGGTFRVLRRASASIRRRPRFGRRDDLDDAAYDEDLESDGLETDEALDEQLLDDQDDQLSGDEDSADEDEETRYDEVQYEEVRYDEVQYDEVQYETAQYEAAQYAEVRHEDDRPDEAYEHAGRFSVRSVRSGRRRDPLQGVDESQLRPVPRRPGRGGYDPDAAELARAYRYARRRRVTVTLLLVTVAFAAAAYLFKPVLWSGTAVFGLLLVAYLAYLRRQVRIENEIQHRRQERLRRARQIRPEYHLDRPDEPVTGSAFGRRDLVVAQVPPSGYRRGREIVDLEDDDPSFDDLDYYQPIQYRRASGQ